MSCCICITYLNTQVHSRLAAVLSAAATRIRFTGYYDLWTSIYQYAVSMPIAVGCPAHPYTSQTSSCTGVLYSQPIIAIYRHLSMRFSPMLPSLFKAIALNLDLSCP